MVSNLSYLNIDESGRSTFDELLPLPCGLSKLRAADSLPENKLFAVNRILPGLSQSDTERSDSLKKR